MAPHQSIRKNGLGVEYRGQGADRPAGPAESRCSGLGTFPRASYCALPYFHKSEVSLPLAAPCAQAHPVATQTGRGPGGWGWLAGLWGPDVRGTRTFCGKVRKGLGSAILVGTPATWFTQFTTTLPPFKAPEHRAEPKKMRPCQELGALLVGSSTSWLGPCRPGGERWCLESFGGSRGIRGTLVQFSW